MSEVESVRDESAEKLNDFRVLENTANELDQSELDQSESVGEVDAVEDDDLPTAQVLEMAIAPLFGVLAPNWAIAPEEVSALAGAYAPVIDKYFGGVAMGVELQAVVVTAMIFAPRIGVARVAVSEKEPKKVAEKEIEEGGGKEPEEINVGGIF
jgi:hypothetical protein